MIWNVIIRPSPSHPNRPQETTFDMWEVTPQVGMVFVIPAVPTDIRLRIVEVTIHLRGRHRQSAPSDPNYQLDHQSIECERV